MDHCLICKQKNHTIVKCATFLSLDAVDRYDKIKRLNACINCLGIGHRARECQSGSCRICNQSHNTLLHRSSGTLQRLSNHNATATADYKSSVTEDVTSIGKLATNREQHQVGDSLDQQNSAKIVLSGDTASTSFSNKGKQIILETALIWLQNEHGNRIQARAVLDPGSQSNFVTSRILNLLGGKRRQFLVPVRGINGATTESKYETTLTIKSRTTNYSATLDFLVLPQITEPLPTHSFALNTTKLDNIDLADPTFNLSRRVDILIGAETFPFIYENETVELCKDLPPLMKSVFGFVATGKMQSSIDTNITSLCSTRDNEDTKELGLLLERFWQLENVQAKPLSMDEKSCENHYRQHCHRGPEGKYSVALPLKQNVIQLGSNAENARLQFYKMERRLLKNTEVRKMYCDFMQEYIDLDHMELVENDKASEVRQYYLPHHPVFKESSTTTKLRVVFNASLKSETGLSLNDALLVGPTMQQKLSSILLRFRLHVIAIVADVSKMYRQVMVHEEYRDLQRIWWRYFPTEDLKSFRLRTVTYGVASAAYLAIRTLFELADDERSRFPKASEILQRDFYVDDLLSGAETIAEARTLQTELQSLLAAGGFALHKWNSNATAIRSESEMEQSSGLLLGIRWNTTNDTIQIELGKFNLLAKTTKRNVLAEIAKIFDPLGLCAPIVMTAKLYMQKIWSMHEIGWDDMLPSEFVKSWEEFHAQLVKYSCIEIPRCVKPSAGATNIQLHGFGDASKSAYGACIYLRYTDDNGNHVHLLNARSRVAPLNKNLTINRLELCAATLLAELMDETKKCLDIHLETICYWSDSQTTLHRINSSPSLYKEFVSNRVSRIQDLSKPFEWHYIPTSLNPADAISRGLLPNELIKLELCWHGPPLLLENKQTWPTLSSYDVDTNDLERKSISTTTLTTHATKDDEFYLFFKCSGYNRMLRIMSYCLRFIAICKKQRINRNHNELSATELEESKMTLIRIVQGDVYAADIRHLKKHGAVADKSNLRSFTMLTFHFISNIRYCCRQVIDLHNYW